MKYTVSSSPHITGNNSTRRVMLDVIIATLPAIIASVLIFGFYPLAVILLSVAAAVGAEKLFCVITKRQSSLGDLSAVVTGIILGLNLPPVVPLYVPVIGAVFAIMIVKMLFGGLGKNFANPAMTARIFLVLAWTGIMTTYAAPIDLSLGAGEMFKYFGVLGGGTDYAAISSATPLAAIKEGGSVNVLDMFLGRIGGSAGETSALALLIGGVYLIIRRVIDWKIPVIYIGGVGVLSCLFKGDIGAFLPAIFGGGLFIGAIFMATDYSTSPNTPLGTVIYAALLAIFTTLFREYSSMSEGVSFAVLLGNILVPLIDKYIVPKPFGYVKIKRTKKAREVAQ